VSLNQSSFYSPVNIINEPKKDDDVDFVLLTNLNNPIIRYRTKRGDIVEEYK